MRKLLFSLFLALISVAGTQAQTTFQKAVRGYGRAKTATASASCSRHIAKLKKQRAAEQGYLYMQAPDKVAIISADGKNKLVMNGTQFTMVQNGKKHKTSSKTNPQFATFYKVFTSILAGGSTDVSKYEGVDVSTQGSNVVITITPVVQGKKRLMFSSFVLTINKSTGALVNLRMNQRKGNYINYAFSHFFFGSSITGNAFQP